MMRRMTLHEAHALDRIKRTMDGEIVLDWIKGSIDALQAEAAEQEHETKLRWNQGAQQALGKVLENARISQDIIGRLAANHSTK